VGPEAADRAEGQWVEHVRLIENLRKSIHCRLEHGDYEEDEGDLDEVLPVLRRLLLRLICGIPQARIFLPLD